MELFFEYKHNKILNFNDMVRREITKCYTMELLKSNDTELTISLIGNYFNQMAEVDYPSYELYASTMLATTQMMINNLFKQNLASEQDQITYNVITYLIDDPSQLLNYIFTHSGIFEDLIYYTIKFENLSVLGKKRVVQNNKEQAKELFNISKFHNLDILRYEPSATTKDFIDYYIETLNGIVKDPAQVVNDIESYMKHLYFYDRNSYQQNLKEMGRVFYKWVKYEISINQIEDKKILKNLLAIEKYNEYELYEATITEDRMLFNIISRFCYHLTSSGMKINNNFVIEESVDEYIKDKVPESLKDDKQKVKK